MDAATSADESSSAQEEAKLRGAAAVDKAAA